MKEILSNPFVLLFIGSISSMLISHGKTGFNSLFTNLKNRFIHTVSIEEGNELYRVVSLFIQNNWPHKNRNTSAKWSKADKRLEPCFSPSVSSFTVSYRGKKLLIDCNRDKMEKMEWGFGLYFGSIKISGFFAKNVIALLLKEALEKFATDRDPGAVGVFIKKGWEPMAEVNEVFPKPLASLVYKDNIHRMLMRDIETFLSGEKWYCDRGITYKRCYCLYGPPGTGKTSLVLSLARELRRDACLLDIGAAVDEAELVRTMAGIPANSIVILEDIDRTLGKKDLKISISTLLNVLDGPFTKKGMLLFMTTNHLDRIDPAIIRDGRIDVKQEIGLATSREVETYLKLFYGRDVELDDGLELPMASVQEACIRNKQDIYEAIQAIYERANTLVQ